MSKPSNWGEMTNDQRRAWQRDENDRYDLETAAEDNRRAAVRAEEKASSLKRQLAADREEAESAREGLENCIVRIRQQRDDARRDLGSLVSLASALSADFPIGTEFPALNAMRRWLIDYHTGDTTSDGGES